MTRRMGSIFSSAELSEFVRLEKVENLQSASIRGPHAKWTIHGNVTCGKFTSINGTFNARGRVRIGKYCAFGQHVSLISGNHRTDLPNQQVWLNQRFGFILPNEMKGPVEIGHNVWIGDKVNVLSGVQVGHGAVLAAGATVTKNVGPFEIAGGNPAKTIRKRFTDKVIAQLLDIAWWDWDDDRIARNKEFFETAIPPDTDIDLKSIVAD